MKVTKWKRLDHNRFISDGGWIHQVASPVHKCMPVGSVYQPAITKALGRRQIYFNGSCVFLSRAIWIVFNGPVPKGYQIDHRNGVVTDDRLSNFRKLSHRDNLRAYRKPKTGTSSQFRGVSWHKRDHVWNADINLNKLRISIGSFSSETEAALAWNHKATELGYLPEALNKIRNKNSYPLR